MSQNIRSTPNPLIPVPQWDPIEALSLDQEQDGHFTCSGVKNGTSTSCGYHIRGDTAGRINDYVADLQMLPPQSAIAYLSDIAELSLCKFHKMQKRNKVTEWTVTINRLASNPPSSSHQSSQGITPPSSQGATSVQAGQLYPPILTPPRSTSGQTDTVSSIRSYTPHSTSHQPQQQFHQAQHQQQRGSDAPQVVDEDLRDTVRVMQAQIDTLMQRIAVLELQKGAAEATAGVGSVAGSEGRATRSGRGIFGRKS